MRMTGGEIIAQFLKNMGVPYVAGIPGHGCLALTDAFYKQRDSIRSILVKQEMAGVHIADGYYRTCGKPLAVFTSIGPGAINAAIGVATCYVDSTPVMLLTGDTHTHMFGRGVLQEIERGHDSNFPRIFEPIVKRYWQVTHVEQLPSILVRAWSQMMRGRRGPVLLSLPMDVQAASCEVDPEALFCPELDERMPADPVGVARAVKLIRGAKRPVILAGGGVNASGAHAELLELAERLGAPVLTTLQGKGAFPEDHPLSAWLAGSKGTGIGNTIAPKADVVLAVGARFADETASSYRRGISYSIPPAKLIHIDIDPQEIGKNYPVEAGLFGDAKVVLTEIIEQLGEAGGKTDYRQTAYFKELDQIKRKWFAQLRENALAATDPVTISRMLQEIREALPRDAIVVSSSGNTQAQILQEFPFYEPYTNLTTGGFSTMGFTLPATIGAKLARPEKPVVGITGDGDFMMTMQELSTAVMLDVPIVLVVADNQGWIAIKDLQMAAFGEDRAYFTDFYDAKGDLYTPDFKAAAMALGCKAERVSKPGEVGPAISRALESGGPYLLDVKVNRTFPISGGAATGWWDVPVPTYLEDRRRQYEKERDEEQ